MWGYGKHVSLSSGGFGLYASWTRWACANHRRGGSRTGLYPLPTSGQP
jgi:hypothetical protein